jgi:hypothetical protein
MNTSYSPEGYPEYEGIINLGNASEPFASESLDMWVLPMSHFAEDPALMTLARVQARLEFMEGAAHHAFYAVSTDSPDWSKLYKADEDLLDALTLCRFAGAIKEGR